MGREKRFLILVSLLCLVGGQADTVSELLSFGCSPREVGKNGATALHLASQAAAIPTGIPINEVFFLHTMHDPVTIFR